MTEQRHTPGPWFIQSHKRNRVCGPEGVIVGEAWYPPARAKREAKQNAYVIGTANARLFAAAPELYALALAFGDPNICDAEFNAMRESAIAKAEGREP